MILKSNRSTIKKLLLFSISLIVTNFAITIIISQADIRPAQEFGLISFLFILNISSLFISYKFVLNKVDTNTLRQQNEIENKLISLKNTIYTLQMDNHSKNLQVLDLKQRVNEISGYKVAIDSVYLASATDLQGRINFANDEFCKVSGYRRDELMGKDHRILNSGYHSKEFWSEVWQTIRNGKIWRGQVRNKKKDGSFYWVNTTVFPRLNPEGGIEEFISIRYDITDQKNNELKLAQTLEDATRSNNVKSLFLASMSHEIRTPLHAIIGMTNLLLQAPHSDRTQSSLRLISKAGESLLSIINDILDFSKIEAGKLDISSTAFDFCGCVEDVATLFTHKAKSKEIALNIHPGHIDSKLCLGDENRIKQILTNLIGNAIKFTQMGSVDIYFEQELNPINNEIIARYIVKDSGIGIKDEDKINLFQSFNQANNKISSEFGGTGLGLVISKKLAELMNGGIDFQSTYGEGSEFIFWVKVKAVDEHHSDHLVENYDDLIPYMENVNVLVAEDNEINQIIIGEHLKRLKVKFSFAFNGQEAVEMCSTQHYDLILMDMIMPVLDGLEATRYIMNAKEIAIKPTIVALTANAYEEDRQKCLQAGMVDFITKPMSEKNLRDCLSRLFVKSKAS